MTHKVATREEWLAAPAPAAPPRHPAGPPDRSPDRLRTECGDQPLAHRLDIDPHGPQRAGIIGVRARHQPGRGQPLQLSAGAGKIQAVSQQQRRRQAGLLPEQAEEHMLVTDVPVAELRGLRQSQHHHLPRLRRQPIPHVRSPPPQAQRMLVMNGLLGNPQPPGDIPP